MSHAIVLVLVNDGQTVEELMAPYDEEIEVAPYQKKCYCVGRIAKDEARKKAEKKYPLDLLREKMKKISPLPEGKSDFDLTAREEEARQVEWDKLLAPRLKLEKEVEEKHPERGKPDPKCEECGGVGAKESAYNPKSKWDWYTEGGRWPGMLGGKDRAKVSTLKVDDNTTPLAVLTPDGEWIEKGTLGWWGMVHNPKKHDEWQDQVREIYKRYPSATAVAIDYHI